MRDTLTRIACLAADTHHWYAEFGDLPSNFDTLEFLAFVLGIKRDSTTMKFIRMSYKQRIHTIISGERYPSYHCLERQLWNDVQLKRLGTDSAVYYQRLISEGFPKSFDFRGFVEIMFDMYHQEYIVFRKAYDSTMRDWHIIF